MERKEKLQTMFYDKKIISLNPNDLRDHKTNAQYFDDLPKDEYIILKNDIEQRGIREALQIREIDTNVFQILSGHQRKKVAIELDIANVPCIIQYDVKTEMDAEEFIIKANVLRRHLTPPQIAKCSIRLMEIEKDKAKQRQGTRTDLKDNIPENLPESKGEARDKVAKQFGISGKQLEKIQHVEKESPEYIKQQWKNGTISTARAYDTIKTLERETQQIKQKGKSVFNRTNENIEWAKWTWNPYRGCKGPNGKGICSYCYAYDIATRFNDKGFTPTFYEDRLDAPANTKILDKEKNISGINNVFVCSMGDLFGDWVKKEWIDKILKTIKKHPNWIFIFLTKNPKRLLEFKFPDNAWVGATIDYQKRVKPTEEAFKILKVRVKFISCEPLKEKIVFEDISIFDWLIIGGQSKTAREPKFQPKWDWVESLLKQAREHNLKIYFKPNLETRPKEYPEG